jgi:arylsulfatase A-like enzyme
MNLIKYLTNINSLLDLMVLLSFIFLVSFNSCGDQSEKPNIIFIMTDDLGYGDVSCYNPESVIRTPNIDKMGDEGIMFTDAHTPASVCTPTRYSVLTGRYAWRSRLKRGVFGGYDKPLIEIDRPTVASFLKQNGYATACIGKWHLGWNWQTKDGTEPDDDYYEQETIDFTKPITQGPNDLGFDYFFGTSGCTTDDPPLCFIENNRAVGIPDRYAAEDPADEGRLLVSVEGWRHEDADFEFMNKALDFIETENSKGNPFFIYLSLSVPHIPWFPHEDFKSKSGAGPRGDQVLMADFIVGEVNKKLEELTIADNTLVIFTSDNGPRAGVNNHHSAWKWRGFKGSIWEGGHRVPFIAKWPGKIKPDTESNQLTVLTDLMATSAAIIGKEYPQSSCEDTYNILPAMLGEDMGRPIRENAIQHSGSGVFALRESSWKLIVESKEGGYDDPPVPGGDGQLYNLKGDPYETNDLYNAEPEVVEKLIAKLKKIQGGNYR